MASLTPRQKLEKELKKLAVEFRPEQTDEELKELLVAAQAAANANKDKEEGEEVEVLRSAYARLTKAGEVFRLYNAGGQLLQTGGKELQKTFGEFTSHNRAHNLNAKPEQR